MKRYVSFDMMRGLAIIGVLGFHLLGFLYDEGAALPTAIDQMNIPFLLWAIFLLFVGSFFSLFILISAIVNTISMNKQWQKLIGDDDSPENRKKVFKKVMMGQLLRGLFIVLVGYISEVLLNRLVLGVLIQEPELIYETGTGFFRAHILVLIGLGIVISSFVYLTMLKNGKKKEDIIKTLFIAFIIILVLTPITYYLSDIAGFKDVPWDERSFISNLGYFILAPIIRDDFPLFPNLAAMFLGLIIGWDFTDGVIKKEVLDDLVKKSLIFFGIGFILGAIGALLDIGEIKDTGSFLMALAGSILAMVIVVYLVEIKRDHPTFMKNTIWLRRFGFISLTLWALQWLMAIPLLLLNWINNMVLGTSTILRDGIFFNSGLNGWASLGVIILTIIMFHGILILWEKIDFKGSFEWITVKILSKGRENAGDRMKLDQTLYNVKSVIEKKEAFYSRGKVLTFWLIFFVMAILYVAVSEFL